MSLSENNIVTINIVNSPSQPFLFLCANNKPFAFKRLVICIQRINFNSVLKQSFYWQMFWTLNGLYFSLLSLIFTSLPHWRSPQAGTDILAFLSTINEGFALSVYFLFALFSAAIRYLPFAPMSLQQVLAISRHTVVPFLP